MAAATLNDITKTPNTDTVLSSLNELSEGCAIKVRVSRLWDTLNIRKRKELMSTDMVLIDEKANYIHATIEKNLAHRFKSVLQEGKIYVIKKFRLAKNKEAYAVVAKNPSMLEFAFDTIVDEEEDNDSIIPHHVFEFVNLADLGSRCNEAVLTDVIGLIIQVNPIEGKKTAQGMVDMMTVLLKDTSGNIVRVTLWEEYATMFGQVFEKNVSSAPKPNIAIFTSTLVKDYQNEVFLSSSRSTKIYINIDIPEVKQLIEAFKDTKDAHAYENMNITHSALQPKVDKVKTISDLLCIATSMIDKSAVYYCMATITEILLKNNWYYVSCPNCKKAASATATNYKCEFCDTFVNYPKLRFRLELKVKDSSDSTIFVLFDEIAEEVAQVKLSDLTSTLETENGDSPDLPRQLTNIIGSTHIFQIKMGSYFAKSGRKSFTASKILKPAIKIEKEDKIEEVGGSSGGSTMIKTPNNTQKRRRLRLQSDEESSNVEGKEGKGKCQIVEDLED